MGVLGSSCHHRGKVGVLGVGVNEGVFLINQSFDLSNQRIKNNIPIFSEI